MQREKAAKLLKAREDELHAKIETLTAKYENEVRREWHLCAASRRYVD
jgi:hypothetical protein